MPEYTVEDTQSGKTITFDWNGSKPPTDKDMEEVFTSAKEFKPSIPTPPIPTTFGEDFSNVMKDTLASAEVVGTKILKGATASLIDIIPTEASTKRLKERGIDPATGASEFIGATLPIGGAAKFASVLVTPLKLAKLPAHVVEGGITGLIYATTKGKAEGKDDFTILKEAGFEGLTFAGFNGLISKALTYLEPLAAKKIKESVVSKLTKEVEGLSKKDAEKVVESAVKGESTEITVSKGTKLYDAKGELIPEELIPKKSRTKKGVSVAPPKPEVPLPEGKLPPNLAGAKPKYSYGEKQFKLEFESDVDKALLIVAQKTPSKHDKLYMGWLQKVTGKGEDELRKLGGLVREEIKKNAKIGDPTLPLEVPTVWQSVTTKSVESPLENVAKQGVQLYSGLPVDKVVDLVKGTSRKGVKWGKEQVRKVQVKGPRDKEDLGLLTSLIGDVLSPSNLSKVHPSAERLVGISISSKTQVEDKFTNIFLRARDSALKGLSSEKKILVSKMLNQFNNVGEIPVELLSRLPQDVLRGFTQMRNRVFDPISRLSGLGEEGGPQKLHAYLTKIFDDTKILPKKQQMEVIKNFARENGIDYFLAAKIFKKGLPDEGFFGPLSKERVSESEVGRIWDLDIISTMYIQGAARKARLDRFLPEAERSLKELPENSRIWHMMKDYVDLQRGLPVTTVQRAFNSTNLGFYLTKIAKYEGMRQYISKLGLSPVAATINLFQYPVFDGTLALAKVLKGEGVGPLQDFGKGLVAFFGKSGRNLARRAGVTLEVGKGEVPFWDEKSALAKLARITNSAFELTERYNKTAAFNRNYSEMKRVLSGIEGMSLKEIREVANAAGIKGVTKTQFFTSNIDKPMALVNPLGATFGRFKTYTIKSLEFAANMDRYEALSMGVILQTLGGVELIPFMKDLRDHMNESYPESPFTETLNGMHKYNLISGVREISGLDINLRERLSPLLPSFRDIRFDSFANMAVDIATEMTGPSVKDLRNLIGDIDSGKINLDDPDWKEILGSKSGSSLNVQIQRTFRALKESESRYTEFARGRKGYELNDTDVLMRAFGLTTGHLESQRDTIRKFEERDREAHEKKIRIEDRFLDIDEKLSRSRDEKERFELSREYGKSIDEMMKFNGEYNEEIGLSITPQTIKSASKQRHLSLAERIGKNKLQQVILMEELNKAKEQR